MRFGVTATLSINPLFSVERPPQADAALPWLIAGIQVAHHGLQVPSMGASSSDVTLKPLSLHVSGVGQRHEPNTGGPTNAAGGQLNLNSQTYATDWRVSSSPFIPVLPPHELERGATQRTLVKEGGIGAEIADFCHGLSRGSATRRAARHHARWVWRLSPLVRPTSLPGARP